MTKKIKVAFGCIFYPLMMGRYMLEALLRREDVEVWTYGPFTGNWIPWAGGMHVDPKYVFKPDLALPSVQSGPAMIRYGMIEMQKPWEPDLWLEVNAGIQTIGKPVSGGPYAVIATDPHVLGSIYAGVRSGADFFFNMQTPYMEQGDIHLPYAYDPYWHAPSRVPMARRKHDAALIGLQYPQRTDLVQRLRTRGLNVFYELGIVYDDARAVYHQTKCGLNWSSLRDTTARCFELMAMRTVPILNRVPDLVTMFKDGYDFIGFDSRDEAIEQVAWYVDYPEHAEAMADRAEKAVKPHTWDARMQSVLEQTRMLK